MTVSRSLVGFGGLAGDYLGLVGATGLVLRMVPSIPSLPAIIPADSIAVDAAIGTRHRVGRRSLGSLLLLEREEPIARLILQLLPARLAIAEEWLPGERFGTLTKPARVLLRTSKPPPTQDSDERLLEPAVSVSQCGFSGMSFRESIRPVSGSRCTLRRYPRGTR